MRPLSNTAEVVQKSFEFELYKKLVVEGYLPDRVTYEDDVAGYKAAKAAIATQKGFAIELFGHGSERDREIKEVPRILVSGNGFHVGSVGGDFGGGSRFDVASDEYKKLKYTGTSSIYRIEITLISQNSFQDRLLESIRQSVLANLTFIPLLGNEGQLMPITYGFVRENNDYSRRLIQRTYIYEALDVAEQTPEELTLGISKLKQINVEFSNSLNNDIDDLQIGTTP